MTTPSIPTGEEKNKATNEELLRKVIEAQVKGGWNGCSRFIDEPQFYEMPRDWKDILPILFHTEGAKAAYGEEMQFDDPEELDEESGIIMNGQSGDVFRAMIGSDMVERRVTIGLHATAHKILNAWLSDQGNNVRAALEAAVSFLPNPEDDK